MRARSRTPSRHHGSGGNSQVGLLAVGDDHGPTTWVDNMYQAVPDLNSRVAGWTTHPYGPNYRTKVQNVINGLARHGAGKAPLFATEFGISTTTAAACRTTTAGPSA